MVPLGDRLVSESMGFVIVNELMLSPSVLNVSDENSRKPINGTSKNQHIISVSS
jgi:hypothetical protein